eukprot:scaffold126232_cov33-Prasinocladus_malaysianus.AAC.1
MSALTASGGSIGRVHVNGPNRATSQPQFAEKKREFVKASRSLASNQPTVFATANTSNSGWLAS